MPYERDGTCIYKVTDGDRELVKCHETTGEAEAHLTALRINAEDATRAVDVAIRALEADPIERRHMLLITSNAYRDREHEIIKEDALRYWVRGAWDGDTYTAPSDHLFWHDGDPIGELIFSDMEGPFLVEVSRELSDAVINLAGDGEDPYEVRVSQLWDALEGRTDMGASHRFKYIAGDEEDGVYEEILKVESTTLPRDRAANPWTLSLVITKGMDMNEKRLEILDRLLGRNGNGKAVADVADEAAATLDAEGVERKDLADQKGLAGDILQGLLDAGNGDVEAVPDEKALEVLDAVLTAAQGAAAPADEAPDEEPTAETQNELKADETLKQLNRLLADQQDFIAAQTKDQAELARAVVSLKDGAEEALKDLTGRLEALERQLDDRPRSVSQAEETLIPETDALQKIEKEIKKGLNGMQTFLNLPVTDQPQ